MISLLTDRHKAAAADTSACLVVSSASASADSFMMHATSLGAAARNPRCATDRRISRRVTRFLDLEWQLQVHFRQYPAVQDLPLRGVRRPPAV
jgi:hypothetical protein